MATDWTASKRPTDFTTSSGDRRSLMVLERLTDQELLQGTWKAIALEGSGQAAPTSSLKDKRILIAGDRYSRTGNPEDLKTYRLDATVSPKAIDIPGSVEGQFAKGIYEFDGDTLKLCFSQSTKLDRPTEFDTDGTRYLCFTFKREEPSATVNARLQGK